MPSFLTNKWILAAAALVAGAIYADKVLSAPGVSKLKTALRG